MTALITFKDGRTETLKDEREAVNFARSQNLIVRRASRMTTKTLIMVMDQRDNFAAKIEVI